MSIPYWLFPIALAIDPFFRHVFNPHLASRQHWSSRVPVVASYFAYWCGPIGSKRLSRGLIPPPPPTNPH